MTFSGRGARGVPRSFTSLRFLAFPVKPDGILLGLHHTIGPPVLGLHHSPLLASSSLLPSHHCWLHHQAGMMRGPRTPNTQQGARAATRTPHHHQQATPQPPASRSTGRAAPAAPTPAPTTATARPAAPASPAARAARRHQQAATGPATPPAAPRTPRRTRHHQQRPSRRPGRRSHPAARPSLAARRSAPTATGRHRRPQSRHPTR